MLIKQVLAAPLESFYTPAASLGGQGATLSVLINPLIKNTLVLSGIVSFFVILFAGFNYISGAGDKNKMTQSTQMLTYGILGLIVVASAFLITNILGKVLNFKFF